MNISSVLCILMMATACKTDAPMGVARSGDAAAEADSAPLQLAATPPTTTPGQISLNGLLARNGMNGVHLAPSPLVRQSHNYTCGAAALQSVLMFWGDDFREGQLQAILRSDPTSGTSSIAMVQLINQLNDPKEHDALIATLATGEVMNRSKNVPPTADSHGLVRPRQRQNQGADKYSIEVYPGKSKQLRPFSEAGEIGVPKDGLSLNDLKRQINLGHPVILLVQAWQDAAGAKWAEDTKDGHYVVAIGYDRQNLYVMDPATSGNYAFIPLQEFADRWHDIGAALVDGSLVTTTVHHFALVFYKSKPNWDLDNVLKME